MEYTFTELVDINNLQKLANIMCESLGYPIAISDQTNHIVVSAGWIDLCTKFHTVNSESMKNCKISDNYIKEHLFENDFVESKCKNGLTDIAVPIVVQGTHYATVTLGQFFYDNEPIDYERFEKQAILYGFDPKTYMEAVDQVPIFSQEKVHQVLNYYKSLILTLVESNLLRMRNSEAFEALKIKEDRIASLFKSMDDLIFIFDKEGHFTEYISPDSHNLLVPSSTFIGKHFSEILPPSTTEIIEKALDALYAGANIQVIEYSLPINNDVRWYSAKITCVEGNAGEGYDYIAVVRDITDLKNNEAIIRQMAYYDTLTGLHNRAMFYERLTYFLAQKRRNAEKLAIIFLDLDNFKKINDTRGHLAGDTLLTIVSNRLKDAVRNTDMIARMGGDEFTIIVNDFNSITDIKVLVERILTSLQEPINIETFTTYISASIGISIYPDDGIHTDDLIKNADSAMYKAKDKGKDCYEFYNQSINLELTEKFKLENDLRHALEFNELLLHYHPIVDTETHSIKGFEALLRWHYKKETFISPLQFIPIAEDTHLIIPIGYWVLRKACDFNVKVHRKYGLKTMIAVNISYAQLKDKNFIDNVIRILTLSGLSPKYLELEITESILIENFDDAVKKLTELKSYGIKITLDDFGTGYSSLGYIKKLPLDVLKIDRVFIQDVCSNPTDQSILQTIVTLAHALNLKVVSEGVEHIEQVNLLTTLESDFIQGYYFYKPAKDENIFNHLSSITQ